MNLIEKRGIRTPLDQEQEFDMGSFMYFNDITIYNKEGIIYGEIV